MNRKFMEIQGKMIANGALQQQLGSLCPLKVAPKARPHSAPSAGSHKSYFAFPIQNISQLERSVGVVSPRTAPVRRSKTTLPPRPPQGGPLPQLAYELIKGALVRYSDRASLGARPPPTAVLVHGILGCRRNMQSFARRLVEGFPSWQVVLVDLRCHGESAGLGFVGAHSVDAAASDVLRLLSSLKLFPEILIGHSFGGKVVMSMAHQFGAAAPNKRLPRPVRVWVLDALPGEVRSGEMGRKDRPADLITTLRRMPLPIASRSALTNHLEAAGFSGPVAAWTALNLTPVDPNDRSRGMKWSFDLDGIAAMYGSYETTDLWPLLTAPAEGVQLSFVKAERSTFRWGGGDEERIVGLGHPVHLLRNSGHWVHTDNPDGLFDILAPTFGGEPDIHMRRSPQGSPVTQYV